MTVMPLKPIIIAALGRDQLKRVVDDLGLRQVDRRSPSSLRNALTQARRATPETVLPFLDKLTLMMVCEQVGVPSKGTRKELIERLLVLEGQSRREEKTDGRLENWLWDAACVVRGRLDAPKYKDYILPLVFLKRLSDVFDDEIARLAHDPSSVEATLKHVEKKHKLVRFFLPQKARWATIAQQTTGLGEYLTAAMRAVARENPKLKGVIDITDYTARAAGQRIVDDGRLAALVQILSQCRLGLRDVEADILGRAYEYLLRKFAEGQGQSGGEQFTPRGVAVAMARILAPQPGMTVYDPCCGSGGLLIKCHLETKGEKATALKLFGQEINPHTFAMARINAFIHDMDAEITLGDTMRRPAFTERQFDIVAANPMWHQTSFSEVYENDPYERFTRGIPPSSSADWAWVQHMVAFLKPAGRMAVVLDTGAVSRGSGGQGSSREWKIRKRFVDEDLIEAVLLLPDHLFYNTFAPGIVMVINRKKRHKGEVLLINASKLFSKGRPKNFLAEQHICQIADVYHQWQAIEAFSTVVTKREIAKHDYNLSPSRYLATHSQAETLPLDKAVGQLRAAEEERAEADRELDKVLRKLGYG